MDIIVEVRTQAELDAALKDAAGKIIRCLGDGYFYIAGSSHVEARESSHVEARGSSHVEAAGAAHVEARDSTSVDAKSDLVVVHIYGSNTHVSGGTQIKVPEIRTPQQWCDWYGLLAADGVVTLFKGVDDSYMSPKGGNYTPGTIPEAPDWDGGKEECGGGLHFSPHPYMTLEFNSRATKFVACPVQLADIVVHCPAQYPQKVKARGCCAPVWECDREGTAQ